MGGKKPKTFDQVLKHKPSDWVNMSSVRMSQLGSLMATWLG